jgi:uncharacterized SAM-binding protein YcdF (DUF218 family)
MPQLRRRRFLILLAAPVVFAALLYGFRLSILTGIFNFLVIRDRLVPADVIFVLNGDTTVRPGLAANLFQQGLAPKVVIARAADSPAVLLGAYPNVTDSNLIALRKLGIPEARIEELRPDHGVTSTYEEAQALLAYTKKNPVTKVIVVTSELHSRRARFIARTVLGNPAVQVMMAPVPDLKYGAGNWWKLEDGIIGCQNEYIKLVFYYFKYS